MTVVAKPGFLRLVLTSSESDPGAVVVALDGPSIDSVSVAGALTLHYVATPAGILKEGILHSVRLQVEADGSQGGRWETDRRRDGVPSVLGSTKQQLMTSLA